MLEVRKTENFVHWLDSLRDIGEILSREKVNVTATRSQSRQQEARMAFTVEVAGVSALQKTLAALREIAGVASARRV